MARSYDIADLMTSDGEYITDNVRRKINGNFRRVLQLLDSEVPAQQSKQIAVSVTALVDSLFDQRLPEMRDQLLDELCPVGSVIVTATASDPRLSHGTWQQVGGGRYVRAAGGDVEVMATGGSNEVAIQDANLPVAEIRPTVSEQADPVTVLDRDAERQPLSVEPEYIALLFYRRIA